RCGGSPPGSSYLSLLPGRRVYGGPAMKFLHPATWIRRHREPLSLRRVLCLSAMTIALIVATNALSNYWFFRYPNLTVNERLAGLDKPILAEHTALVV